MKQNIFLILSIFIITASGVQAVERVNPGNFQGGLNFQVGFPQKEFASNAGDNAFGLNLQMLYAPDKSPVGIGVVIGFENFSTERRKEPFSTTIPDVTVDVVTTNNAAQFLGVLRLRATDGPIRPYADGLAGFNYLFTETRIENASNNEEVASSTNFDDGVFAYGVGGGVELLLARPRTPGGVSEWLLHVGGRYLVGGSADYLTKGSIRRNGTTVTYDVSSSETDELALEVGVAIRF